MAPKTPQDKLSELLSTFDKDELAQILTQELSAETRRAIKVSKAADPAKKAVFESVFEAVKGEAMEKIVAWAESANSRSCTISGDAPEGIESGSGDNYDKLSFVFRFSSPAIRKAARTAREAKESE